MRAADLMELLKVLPPDQLVVVIGSSGAGGFVPVSHIETMSMQKGSNGRYYAPVNAGAETTTGCSILWGARDK